MRRDRELSAGEGLWLIGVPVAVLTWLGLLVGAHLLMGWFS